MKKAMLLLAVLGSVFFAGCAKEDSATMDSSTEVKNPDGSSTEVKVDADITTETR